MNDDIIQELLEIELWADSLRKKCRKVREKLEGVSTPSVRKGKYNDIVAAAVAARNKKAIRVRS